MCGYTKGSFDQISNEPRQISKEPKGRGGKGSAQLI